MGYIFEQEIDSIINAVRAKTIGEEDDVLLKTVLSAGIHPALKAYFKAEVEKELEHERETEIRAKKFPYGLPQVVSLQQQIDILLVQNYQFTKDEFDSLLDESVHFQFNYLCRPQWTLLNFIVGDARRVQASVIEKKLRYCVDYTYFPELIRRYFVAHGVAGMSYEDFKALLEKIDREVVAQHSSMELAQMTRALFSFVESGKMVPHEAYEQQTLPINAAIVFFEDKQMNDIRVRLEFERDRNMINELTLAMLADIIEIVRTGNETASAVFPAMSAHVEEQTDLEKYFAERAPERLFDTPAPSVNSAQSLESKETTKKSVLVFGDNDDQYLKATPGEKQDELLSLFSDTEQDRVVKKLFKNDKPAFLAFMMETGLTPEWSRVAHQLDSLFITNEVDPFSSDAVFFTDRLAEHFKARTSAE